MKSKLFALCVACAFFKSVFVAYGEERTVLVHRADAYLGGSTNEWWLPVSQMERLPQWRGEGDPPLSLKKALKIARKWITPQSGNGDVNQLLLRPLNPDGPGRYASTYFYVIEFCVAPYGNHITCVVLMDGTVLNPKRK